MNYYPTEITGLPDEELIRLQREIEDSGVLGDDQYDYPEDSWEYQAHTRWYDFVKELRRRHPEPIENVPGGMAALIQKRMDEEMEKMNGDLAKSIFEDGLFSRLNTTFYGGKRIR